MQSVQENFDIKNKINFHQVSLILHVISNSLDNHPCLNTCIYILSLHVHVLRYSDLSLKKEMCHLLHTCSYMYHLLYNFWFKCNSVIPPALCSFNNVSHLYPIIFLKFILEINDVLSERQIVILSTLTSCF